MKRWMTAGIALALGFGVALLAGSGLQPQQSDVVTTNAHWRFVADSPETLIEEADLIVVAEHIMAQAGRVVGNVPFTLNGFVVQRVLKGDYDDVALVIEQTGGMLDDHVRLSINDGGSYAPDHRYLLFLKNQRNEEPGPYYLINHQGRYEIAADVLIGVDPDDAVVQAFESRDLQDVLQLIAEYAG